jgi:hypothetical protein
VLVAVRQLAGPASGLTIVDKAAAISNTLRVLQALEEVAKLLQVRACPTRVRGQGLWFCSRLRFEVEGGFGGIKHMTHPLT